MVGVFCNLRAESCAARKPKLANLEKMSTTTLVLRFSRTMCPPMSTCAHSGLPSDLSVANPEISSQLVACLAAYSFSDTGSDSFLGDCLSNKEINSRPEAGMPALPWRTISLALMSRP